MLLLIRTTETTTRGTESGQQGSGSSRAAYLQGPQGPLTTGTRTM